MNLSELREDILGVNEKVETLNGVKDYIFFDNAASAPALKSVYKKMEDVLKYYSNVHRGAGYKAYFSTEAFEESREIVKEFIGAGKNDTVIFVKNATEALNKLARIMKDRFKGGKVVVSEMEHHSNILPWKKHFDIVWWPVNEEGKLEIETLEEILKKEGGDIKVVSVTGASNVTGFTNPVHKIAKIAHKYGALISVDGAQLVPHAKIRMDEGIKEEKIDFLSFSAHKIYSPFGSGALVGDESLLDVGEPACAGGGTILFVQKDEILWADLPEREEAGTPNIPGAINLALTIQRLEHFGMENLEKRELELSKYFLERFYKLNNFELLGKNREKDAFSVFSFAHKELNPFLIAAVLSAEEGIGVRAGCFCAHPYLTKIMGFSKEKVEEIKKNMLNHKIEKFPGAVRASLSFYNNENEIDRLFDILNKIDKGEINTSEYKYYDEYETFFPKNFRFKKPDIF